MKSFLQLRTEINASIFPSGVPENLAEPLRDDNGNPIAPAPLTMLYQEALAEVAKWVTCEQKNNPDIVKFCNSYFKCGMTVIDAPNGVVSRLYTVEQDEEGAWCSPVFYRQEEWPVPEQWAQNLLAEWTEPDTTGRPTLPMGFKRAEASTDRYEAGDEVGRSYTGVWAIHDQKIWIAPWIQSTESVVVEWAGIKSSWKDDDAVNEDQDYRKAVKLYVQSGFERDYGDAAKAKDFKKEFGEALADLIWQCRERTKVQPRIPQFRDERMIITHLPCCNTSCGCLRHGNGPPSDSLGSNGDIYVDEDTGNIYSKSLGTWTLYSAGGGGGGNGQVGVVDPEGVVTASPGTTYWNSSNNTLWVKVSGTGNTGWVQII